MESPCYMGTLLPLKLLTSRCSGLSPAIFSHMAHIPAKVAGPVKSWWPWSWLPLALWLRIPLRRLGVQRSSQRIPLTSNREIASLQLDISSLDTQVHGNWCRLLQTVLLRNKTTKGMSLMLNKLLCQTSMLCKVGGILKGIWSLLYSSLKQR